MATSSKKVYTYDILDMETPVPPPRIPSPDQALSNEAKKPEEEDQNGGTAETQGRKIIFVKTIETKFQVQLDKNWLYTFKC